MARVIWSQNETPAFRHFFHYYYFVGEADRLTPPEQAIYTPNYLEAELAAYDYKEYLNGVSGMAGKQTDGERKMKELRNRYCKETPALRIAPGRTACRVCEKRIPKGEMCIELALTGGPAGTAHLCLKHANIMAAEITSLVGLAQTLMEVPNKKFKEGQRWAAGGKDVWKA